jgi:rubrerythrin
MLKQDARNVVQLLMDHELALKELYQAYATALPSLKDLWSKLAADEQRHADWLDSLGPEVGSTPRPGPQGWPRPAAIESSLKYLRAQILRARQAQVTTLTALAVAKDLESALLEKEFFKVADLPPGINRVLRFVRANEATYARSFPGNHGQPQSSP